jgi:predicted Zn finger-like uncharacterized protein
MALATQCPHCHTRFRVAADQLKLRGGIVRCGACQAIFDGSAHLIDLDAAARKDEPPASSPASPPSSPASTPAPEAAPAPHDEPDGEVPVYTLELGHTLDPLGILPEAVTPDETQADDADAPASTPAVADLSDRVEPTFALTEHAPAAETAPVADFSPRTREADAPASYAPAERVEPSFGLPVDEELVAQPVRGEEALEETHAPATAADSVPLDAAPAPAEADTAPPTPPAAPAPWLAAAADVPPGALPLRASSGNAPAAASIPPPPPTLKPASKSGGKGSKNARRSKLTPTRIDAPKLRVPESDEPEFVKRSKRQEQAGRLRRIVMGVGVAILLLLLAAQAVLEFRNVLAARVPPLKPLLAGACVPFGCRVGLPAQVENLAIETGELSPLGSDTYTLNTLLRNSGNLVQAWPAIQLELIDDAGKPLLRRVFKPAEYVPAPALAGGFAARSEQPVRLDFALAGPKPAGYHLFVFYP